MQTINWPGAIERNREALLRIVAALFGLVEAAGIVVLGPDPRMPRHLRCYVLRILRPAESAARRLVVIAAREIPAPNLPLGKEGNRFPKLRGQRPGKCLDRAGEGAAMPNTAPTLPLLDPLPRFDLRPRQRRPKGYPRISIIGVTEPRPVPGHWIASPDDPVSARGICRRLTALKRTLDDLDGLAKRLARWRARRDWRRRQPYQPPGRFFPLKPGRPPGYRKRPRHEVDDVLRECHALAICGQAPPDG